MAPAPALNQGPLPQPFLTDPVVDFESFPAGGFWATADTRSNLLAAHKPRIVAFYSPKKTSFLVPII
jgi:hypothetical protein